MKAHAVSFVVMLIASCATSASADPGDAQRGRAAFAQCAACHSLSSAPGGIGPSLAGVLGRPIGSIAGYAYSKPLAAARTQKWTAGRLDAFLAKPSAAYAGTKMFSAVSDAQTRADIIAYLTAPPAR